MAQQTQSTDATRTESSKNIGTNNTGTQSAAQRQSGQGTTEQPGKNTTKQAGVERSTGDTNDGDFDRQSTAQVGRQTGETPNTNRGFSQTESGGQNEMSQRVAGNSPEKTDSDELDEVPHRTDPSSINQVSQQGGNSDGFPPDLQMNNESTSNRH